MGKVSVPGLRDKGLARLERIVILPFPEGRLERKTDCKAGVIPRSRGYFDVPSMSLHRPADYGKAESRALDLCLRVVFFNAVEASKNEGQIRRGDTYAIVADPDVEPLFGLFPADYYSEGNIGILLEGIFDEIEQNLGPVKAVALQEKIGLSRL
mgnify:CR=1 FL=1